MVHGEHFFPQPFRLLCCNGAEVGDPVSALHGGGKTDKVPSRLLLRFVQRCSYALHAVEIEESKGDRVDDIGNDSGEVILVFIGGGQYLLVHVHQRRGLLGVTRQALDTQEFQRLIQVMRFPGLRVDDFNLIAKVFQAALLIGCAAFFILRPRVDEPEVIYRHLIGGVAQDTADIAGI
ncbi:MAG: hypothetical protein IJA20_01905 [Methanocorpusculum sp.]|nr:hypothetical protein [Methanocorpusculum sp.]